MLIILSCDRRRIRHFNVTDHPNGGWRARQLLEACGIDEAPQYLFRDRDAIYVEEFHRQAAALTAFEIKKVPTAPQPPWQNPYAEWVIGSIGRDGFCP